MRHNGRRVHHGHIHAHRGRTRRHGHMYQGAGIMDFIRRVAPIAKKVWQIAKPALNPLFDKAKQEGKKYIEQKSSNLVDKVIEKASEHAPAFAKPHIQNNASVISQVSKEYVNKLLDRAVPTKPVSGSGRRKKTTGAGMTVL